MVRYLSGRTRTTDSTRLTDDRYEYLSLSDAEPNLGDPVAPGDVLPAGLQYQIISIEGYPGERYWVPRGGGIIPGSISIYDEGLLVGGINSTTQLNFTGSAIQATGSNTGLPNPGIGITIAFTPPGVDGQVLYKDSGDFATSTGLTFDASEEYLGIGGSISVGADRSVFNAGTNNAGIASVGINTASPTYTLDINGDVRIRGTIVDYNGNEGTLAQVLTKNDLGGLTWIDSGALPAAAGGYYRTVQFHNNVGVVDGALEFVYNDIQGSVGIGSTIPKTGKRLDVLGDSLFTGNIEIVGVLTATDLESTNLGVSGIATAQELTVFGGAGFEDIDARNGDYTGIVTAAKFIGNIDVVDLFVTGIATFNSIGATGIITTNQLTVYDAANFQGNTNVERLNVTQFLDTQDFRATGISTLGSIKIENSTLSTNAGNIIINSGGGGILEVIDPLYVNNATQSTSSGTGSIITLGGVGIAKNLNVDGEVRLATNGGITTTGGDLYVNGDLYVTDDVFYDEISARRGEFTEYLQTDDFYVTGVSTFLGNVYMDSREIGISTFVDNKTTWDLRNNDPSTHDTSSVVSLSAASGFVWNNEDVSGINTTLTITGWWDDNAYIDNRSADGKIIFRTGFTEEGAQQSIPDLLIDANGNIGIGTDNPTAGLEVVSNSSSDAVRITQTGSGNALVVEDSANPDATAFVIDNAGRIGVRTDNPNGHGLSLFDTSLQITSGEGGGTYGGLTLSYESFFDAYYILNWTKPLYIGGGDVILQTGSSKVGIGSTTPTEKLDVNGNVIPSITSSYDLGSNSRRWDNLYVDNINGATITGSIDNADKVSTGTTTGIGTYYLTFVDSNNTSRDYENLYTDAGIAYNPNTNRLGIGTDNPEFSAHIAGYGNTNGILVGDTHFYAFSDFDIHTKGSPTFKNTLTNADTVLRIIPNGTGKSQFEFFVNDYDNNLTSWKNLRIFSASQQSNPYIRIDTSSSTGVDALPLSIETQVSPGSGTRSNANQLFLNTDGNIGIGTNVPQGKLDIDGNVIPRITSSYDLGSSSRRWGTLYVDNIDGASITGSIDNADKVSTGTTTGTGNYYLTFVDSNNTSRDYENLYTDGGIVYDTDTDGLILSSTNTEGALRLSGTVGSIVIDDLGQKRISWNDGSGNFNIKGGHSFSSSADRYVKTGDGAAAIIVNSDNMNGTIDLRVAPTGNEDDVVNFSAGVKLQGTEFIPTYASSGNVNLGSSSNRWGTLYVDNIDGATITGSIDKADKVSAGTTTGTDNYYLTFVDSNNTSRDYENLYTDGGIVYNPSGNLLKISDGKLIIPSTSATIAGNTFDNGWLQIGTSTLGITMDSNELYFAGGGIIGALPGGSITFSYGAKFGAGIRDDKDSLGSSGQVLSSTGSDIEWINPGTLSAGNASNLSGGAAGSIPYQDAPGSTVFLSEPNANNKVLSYNNTTNAPVWVNLSSVGAVSTFTGLSDTPSNYTNSGGKVVRVNSSGNALEFVNSTSVGTDNFVNGVSFSNGTLTLSRTGSLESLTTTINAGDVGAPTTFLALSDTPSNYTNSGGKVVRVNSSGNALEFVNSTSVGTDNFVNGVSFSNGTLTLSRTGSLESLTTTINVGTGTVQDVTVSQTSYNGTNPITVTSPTSGTEQINIPDSSNAYGTRYIATYTPTTEGEDGDIWYQVSS